MTCGIYTIEIDNWFYIGSSLDIEKRISKHLSLMKCGKHFNAKVQNVWNKYQDFNWGILKECEQEELLTFEQKFLDNNFHKENCLNINPVVNCGVPIPIPVYQWSLDGDLIGVYESAAEASRQTGICVTGISNNRLKVQKSAGGFIWTYKDTFPGEPIYTKPVGNRTKGRIPKNRVSVYQWSLDGDLVKCFESLAHAEKETKISFKSISNNIRGKSKSAGGFIWSYENEFPGLDREPGGKKKIKVSQFDKDGKFIKQFDSMSEAAKELGLHMNSISRCVNGELKSTGGFVFKEAT